MEVYLAAAANGHAWLASLDKSRMLKLVFSQGFPRHDFGPGAPRTIAELEAMVDKVTDLGYAIVVDSYEMETSAIASTICAPGKTTVLRTISVAGPSARMSMGRLTELAPLVADAASELSILATSSPLFRLNTN